MDGFTIYKSFIINVIYAFESVILKLCNDIQRSAAVLTWVFLMKLGISGRVGELMEGGEGRR